MKPIETQVLREHWNVDRRLLELGVSREPLMTVVQVAMNAGANATPFHCANAQGTLSYQQGTWALRNEFVGDDWRIDRTEGVEAIWNEKLKIRIVFSNVDICCNDDAPPKPRSKKGSGAERVCMGNLFGELPRYAPPQTGNIATYYLMVDENGAAELTRPVISDETFSAYIERIYLSDSDDDLKRLLPLDEDDAAADFDPQVVRK